ncbi:hypothetical protein ACHAWF_013574 [Thalassiosira exigua]
MDETLSAPRDLTESELLELRGLLKAQLNLSGGDDDEDDAENLLDYAGDMIEGGECVGRVCEELKFMEMPACDDAAASRLAAAMCEFFTKLDNGDDEVEGEEKSSKDEAPAAVTPEPEEPEGEPEPEPKVEPKPEPKVEAPKAARSSATHSPAPKPEPARVKPTPAPTPSPAKPATGATPSPRTSSFSRSSNSSGHSPGYGGGGRSSFGSTSSYGSPPPSSGGSSSWSSRHASSAIQGDARSQADRRQSEMKEAFGSGSGGGSVKDRMKMFNAGTSVNFDPVHFAVKKNKEEKGSRKKRGDVSIKVLEKEGFFNL